MPNQKDDQHADILTPAFSLSGSTAPPSYSSMSSQELDAYLTEMETDIRAADRDLREIDSLERHGVLTAGKLPGEILQLFYEIQCIFIKDCIWVLPLNTRDGAQCIKWWWYCLLIVEGKKTIVPVKLLEG